KSWLELKRKPGFFSIRLVTQRLRCGVRPGILNRLREAPDSIGGPAGCNSNAKEQEAAARLLLFLGLLFQLLFSFFGPLLGGLLQFAARFFIAGYASDRIGYKPGQLSSLDGFGTTCSNWRKLSSGCGDVVVLHFVLEV